MILPPEVSTRLADEQWHQVVHDGDGRWWVDDEQVSGPPTDDGLQGVRDVVREHGPWPQ
jgi:hypothetical protein